MDKGLAPEPANLSHNLTETSKGLLSGNKATEVEKPGEEGWPFLPLEQKRANYSITAGYWGQRGGFVSNSSGFSAYTLCPLLPTLLLIPLI